MTATQPSLPLPAPPALADEQLVPARMVNEWVYCPRLAYLEWVEGEWAANADTAQGNRMHARGRQSGPPLPDPADERRPTSSPAASRSPPNASASSPRSTC